MDIVEDEAELVHVFDRLLVRSVLRPKGGGEAADGGCVQHFADLERKIESGVDTCVTVKPGPIARPGVKRVTVMRPDMPPYT